MSCIRCIPDICIIYIYIWRRLKNPISTKVIRVARLGVKTIPIPEWRDAEDRVWKKRANWKAGRAEEVRKERGRKARKEILCFVDDWIVLVCPGGWQVGVRKFTLVGSIADATRRLTKCGRKRGRPSEERLAVFVAWSPVAHLGRRPRPLSAHFLWGLRLGHDLDQTIRDGGDL